MNTTNQLPDTQRIRPPDPIETFQPIRIQRIKKGRKIRTGCWLPGMLIFLMILMLVTAYLVLPNPVNFIVMGIDRTPEGTALGRSDALILVSIHPLKPDAGMLSIPRDLWVFIPGVGENRINTAHYFAEANQPGSGPQAVLDTFAANFQVNIPYYVRFQFNGFREIIKAMGGITIELEKPTGGYDPGTHHLDADQALAFVRDRAGSDDFFRMERGQIFFKAVVKQALKPATWGNFPEISIAVFDSLDTNMPFWQWPRIAVAILRIGIDNIDSQTIDREMVNPITTSEGANVLLPRWEIILPVMNEILNPE